VHMGTSDLLFWKKKIKNHISKFIFVEKKILGCSQLFISLLYK
jgi:hypothetical protein